MIAETIFVGTELLLGQIVNANAAYLGEQLSLLGIDSYHQSVVNRSPPPGVLKRAVNALMSSSPQVDWVPPWMM